MEMTPPRNGDKGTRTLGCVVSLLKNTQWSKCLLHEGKVESFLPLFFRYSNCGQGFFPISTRQMLFALSWSQSLLQMHIPEALAVSTSHCSIKYQMHSHDQHDRRKCTYGERLLKCNTGQSTETWWWSDLSFEFWPLYLQYLWASLSTTLSRTTLLRMGSEPLLLAELCWHKDLDHITSKVWSPRWELHMGT